LHVTEVKITIIIVFLPAALCWWDLKIIIIIFGIRNPE